MTRRSDCQGDRGAFLIVFALCLTVLILIVALVVDLGFSRSDRREAQTSVDNSAATAAQTLARSGNGQTSCADAFQIVGASLGVTFSGQDCSQFASACVSTVSRATTGSAGSFSLTFTNPVLANSPLLANTSTISNGGVAATAADGTPCERVGVLLTTSGPPFFGGIVNSGQRSSSLHAVGRASAGTLQNRPLNMLALERTDCRAIDISGQGIVRVKSFLQGGKRLGGVVGVDSNGTTDCEGGKAAIEANSQGILRANGPCAAPDEAIECDGTGRVDVFRSPIADPTCVNGAPACLESGTGTITPNVTSMPARFTRAPIDYFYDCRSSYSDRAWYSEQPIPGCAAATDATDYVAEMHQFASTTPAGFTVLNDCSPDTTVPYVGNYFVDCDSFTPKNASFADGNVIFRGDVKLGKNESLTLHGCTPACNATLSWVRPVPPSTAPLPNYLESESSSSAAWAYVRGGFSMTAGSFTTNALALFIGSGTMSTTGGAMTLRGPTAGPFEDLALWSEGTGVHTLTGGGALVIDGVFFTGRATLSYVGDGNQILDRAQLIANKFNFSGKGEVSLSPLPDRAIQFPADPSFGLIR